MATFFKVIKQSLYLKERIRACDVYTLYFTFPYFYVLYHVFRYLFFHVHLCYPANSRKITSYCFLFEMFAQLMIHLTFLTYYPLFIFYITSTLFPLSYMFLQCKFNYF